MIECTTLHVAEMQFDGKLSPSASQSSASIPLQTLAGAGERLVHVEINAEHPGYITQYSINQ